MTLRNTWRNVTTWFLNTVRHAWSSAERCAAKFAFIHSTIHSLPWWFSISTILPYRTFWTELTNSLRQPLHWSGSSLGCYYQRYRLLPAIYKFVEVLMKSECLRTLRTTVHVHATVHWTSLEGHDLLPLFATLNNPHPRHQSWPGSVPHIYPSNTTPIHSVYQSPIIVTRHLGR